MTKCDFCTTFKKADNCICCAIEAMERVRAANEILNDALPEYKKISKLIEVLQPPKLIDDVPIVHHPLGVSFTDLNNGKALEVKRA